KAPERADFLAQHNQEGSGTLKEKAQLTTRHKADFHDNAIREISPLQQLAAQREATPQRALVATTASSTRHTAARDEDDKPEQEAAGDTTILQRSLEIASLEAKLDIQRQAYAARPRVRRLTSV